MTHTLQQDFRAALAAFEQYLVLDPDSEYAPKVRKIIREYTLRHPEG
ncbi:MAG: hypothetical protein R3C68_08435 [Myxococcota bacterium]